MKDIMMKITGKHINKSDELEDDGIEFITEGKAYRKGNSTYVIYRESAVSGMEGASTTLKITEDGNVRMKRFGNESSLDTVMEFRPGIRYTGMYETPYGSFEMEVLTNRIINQIEPVNLTGSLHIDYEITLKGLAESRSTLSIQLFDGGVAMH